MVIHVNSWFSWLFMWLHGSSWFFMAFHVNMCSFLKCSKNIVCLFWCFLYSKGVPCSLRFWNLLAIQPRAVQPSLFTYGLSSPIFWPMGYPAQYYWSTHGQRWKTCGLSSPTVLTNLWAIQPKAIQPSLLTLWAIQPNYLTIGFPA